MEYMEVKRYLYGRASPEGNDRTEKQQAREIMKGLLPQVRLFCERKLKDLFNAAAKSTLDTLDGVKKLLNCMYEDRKVLAINDHRANESALPVTVVKRYDGNSRQQDSRRQAPSNSLSEFEKLVISKFESIECDIANMKDRV